MKKNDLGKIISGHSAIHPCPIDDCTDFECRHCPIGKALDKLDEGVKMIQELIENGYIEE